MDPKFWPDPAAMNKQLHDMGFETMISVWPRFVPEDRYLCRTRKRTAGSFTRPTASPSTVCPTIAPDPTSTPPIPTPRRGTGRRFATTYLSKGFDSLWADETEPDLPPNGAYYQIGPGTQYLQRVSAASHGRALRRLPQRRTEQARADSVARRVSGRAAKRRHRLVVGHLSDMGHFSKADSNRPRLRGFGNYVLVQRHRRLAVSAGGASSRASAAARSHPTHART